MNAASIRDIRIDIVAGMRYPIGPNGKKDVMVTKILILKIKIML